MHDLQVDEGGRVTLTLRDISATDADTPIDQLAVFAEVLPSFGVLENTKKGEIERQQFYLFFIVFVDYSTFRIYTTFLFKKLSWAAEILI